MCYHFMLKSLPQGGLAEGFPPSFSNLDHSVYMHLATNYKICKRQF